MSVFLQPIYTQTVGAGGASTITFNNIPQTFTDLKVVASMRDTGANIDYISYLTFNNDAISGLYSNNRIYGNSASAISDRFSNVNFIYGAHDNGAGSTSNTFTNCEIYIPNYRAANFKSTNSDYVVEQNSASTSVYQVLVAGLWRNTNAITSLSLTTSGTAYVTNSTFSLYGVLRQGI
jgi:hypothetical protein